MLATRVESSSLLKELGYDYYSYVEPAIKPEHSDKRFLDILPQLEVLGKSSIAYKPLYIHQVESYQALCSGKNLILRSGTGSGKTEAWLLYTLSRRVPTLAVYPTLALANDQIRRISEYAKALNLKVEVIDALRRDQLIKEYGRSKLRSHLTSRDIIVTNPAFLLHEVKKMSTSAKGALLDGFLNRAQLIVLDEIDFYGPREIALLLAMLEILSMTCEQKFQLAALTATIENPEELASFFTKVTKKETSIIHGPPFRVENRLYVVLSRDLRSIWNALRLRRKVFEQGGVGEDILKALDDFDLFKEQVYKVAEAARALNIPITPLEPDPVDILKGYVEDSGVTLVFTKSIARAEELARKLKTVLPDDKKEAVAAHHHLASKEYRAIVEEGARQGKVKVLISPRTLSQGIDIGTVIRIVHVGLPESLREFYQREGRKGRREELQFSETVILPSGKWDRDILSRGLSALKSWLDLPIEKVIINPENKYMTLFKSLLKFVSPKLRQTLSREEQEFLESLGLVRRGELTVRGKDAWKNMNFYEFAPPFGINRVMVVEDGERYLEGISHCDLVEKFQPGCIDYTSDGIVVEHRIGGRTGRTVTAVIEEKLRESTLWKKDALAQALEEYEEVKVRWGETPSILSDYAHGRLHSEVICVVYPPKRGFGRYVKIPDRVLWRVVSASPKVKKVGKKTITYRDFKVIEVPTATYGKYSDYTYGMMFELEPDEDTTLLRIGLALLMVVLRKKLRIPFETIMYSLGKVGEKKFMELHEPESAGLLERLDWLEVKKLVESYEPEDLDEVLMESFDDYAYSDFVTLGLDWDQVKRFALKALDYILLEQKLLLKFKGVELALPKPSRALKLAAIDAIYIPLIENADTGLISICLYDGEEPVKITLYRDFSYIKDTSEADAALTKLINQDFTILAYGLNPLLKTLSDSGLKSASLLLRSLREEGKAIDVKEELSRTLNIELIPLEEVEKAIGVKRETTLADVMYEAENSKKKIAENPPGEWKNFTKYLREEVEKYLGANCKTTYILHLIAVQLHKAS